MLMGFVGLAMITESTAALGEPWDPSHAEKRGSLFEIGARSSPGSKRVATAESTWPVVECAWCVWSRHPQVLGAHAQARSMQVSSETW